MLVLHDPATLLHSTVELLGAKLIPALESPERITAIISAIQASEDHDFRTINHSTSPDAQKVLLSELLTASHDVAYLHHLRTAHETWLANGLLEEDESLLPECFRLTGKATGSRTREEPKDVFARAGFYAFDMSSGIMKDSWKAIEASAGLAVEGTRVISSGEAGEEGKTVLALCRPPGHHCTTDMAGGYCYVNNVVVAVHALRHFSTSSLEQKTEEPKIAILDIDFHHGNGTQDVFYTSSSVLYTSIHGLDEYPYYSGFPSETGSGPGEGFNFNFPLPPRSYAELYLETLDLALEKIKTFEPKFLLVSLGFDTFHLDPLGGFGLERGDYEKISSKVRAVLGEVPSLILLEGGYVIDRLGENMLAFLKGWEGEKKSKQRSIDTGTNGKKS